MEYTVLGKTGLRVSVMGMGCGGPSRAGQKYGKSEEESVAIIRQAMEAGVNIIDTSEGYNTEGIIGKAIDGVPRDRIVLSTKKATGRDLTEQAVIESLETSLKELGTDYIDIYHFHGVAPDLYEVIRERFVPLFEKLKEQGKIRFIGISESGSKDPQHNTLQRALEDDVWDVMMVCFNILNQSARDRVFRKTREKNIGVLNMFAVRLALSRKQRLTEVLRELLDQDLIEEADIDLNDPLGFLIREGGAVSLPDAAYRLCRYEPGVHVVLSGTGNPDHLRANLESLLRPPLPSEDLERLRRIFAKVDCVSGQ